MPAGEPARLRSRCCAWRWLAGGGLVLALWSIPTAAEEPSCASGREQRVTIGAVSDAVTLTAADGRSLRLAGVLAAPARFPEAVEEARRAVEAEALGRSLAVRPIAAGEDRYGRLRVQAFRRDQGEPLWLQGMLVRRGLALVAGLPGEGECARELLAHEADARAARRGLWGSGRFRTWPADPAALDGLLNQFVIVEGAVVEVGRSARNVFLNFGADWRDDVTGLIARSELAALAASGLEVDRLKGRRVRLRGWLERWNGPLIRIRAPAQLEALE